MVKKASQSSQSAWAGFEDVVTEVTRLKAVSSGAEEVLWLARKARMGIEKGFGGLLPGILRIVVILDKVGGS